MTRKDHVRIAAILACHRRLAARQLAASAVPTLDLVATDLADVFAENDPLFDRARFEEACRA